MPALVRAAAIFDCCVMSRGTEGLLGSDRRMTTGKDGLGELGAEAKFVGVRLCGITESGDGHTSIPGFSAIVPMMNRGSFGLIQRSSMRTFEVSVAPWRARKLLTCGGACGEK